MDVSGGREEMSEFLIWSLASNTRRQEDRLY